MRRCVVSGIILLLILALSGCSGKNNTVEQPANFYYCTSSISFDTAHGVIAPETRDIAGFEQDLTALINHYLRGPNSSNLTSPFPNGSAVLWINQSDRELTLIMNQQFTQLTGLNLSLACSCISKTIFSLTDFESITIRARDTNLDGTKSVTMTRDSILIQDRIMMPPA